MAGLTNYMEQEMLDWGFTTGSPTRPTTWYVALFTTTPTGDDGSGGVEATGGSYARESVTLTRSGSTMNPTATVTFTTATANWGTINGFGIFDAVSGGNLLAFDDVVTPKAINNGDTAEFATTDLSITLD